MLEEILKKESVDENDIKVLVANLHRLSYEDKVRYGFLPPQTIEEEVEIPKKPTTRRKKVV